MGGIFSFRENFFRIEESRWFLGPSMADAMGEKRGNSVYWDKKNVHQPIDMIRYMRLDFAARLHDTRSRTEDLVKEAKEQREREKSGGY